ncbi:hypothetical protein PYW08_006311 [Mythimna loreyi]|uniref:Uncharacterized protein n=1 Tax=Mythimna loreyi TaxID=667449 RepID=A0ACC2QNC3_9NEOP|nr:hypothetical protein PYW08_006311 [Mythimna loreyi]
MNRASETKDFATQWQNLLPASTRYYCPVKFMIAKETVNVITTEVNKIKEQVTSLSPTKMIVNDIKVLVKPTLIFCMIDGKICNDVASYASTQTCYLCDAKGHE